MSGFFNLFLLVLISLKVILCDDCPPCKCEIYYDSAITCSDTTVDFFNPLTYVPTINFTESMKWEVINILNQPLKILSDNAFSNAGLFYLETIIIKNCEISFIFENAFTNISSLYDLDLSENKLTDLNDNVFKQTKHIKFLRINSNKLTYINDKIFANIPDLEILELNDNSLLAVHQNAFLNNNKLIQLHLMNNNLTTLDINVIKTIKSFTTLKINGNPFICDCLLQDLHEFILHRFKLDRSNNYKELTNTTCIVPQSLSGIEWRKLTKENFNCWLNSKPFKETVKAIIEANVTLSCEVDGNTLPNVTWTLDDKIINLTNKKYNSNITLVDYAKYKYNLVIFELNSEDKGTYKCIFEDFQTEIKSMSEIKLILEKQPISILTIIITVGVILFLFCVVALIIKCVIRCFIVNNSTENQPKFGEDFKRDNVSIHSSKSQSIAMGSMKK